MCWAPGVGQSTLQKAGSSGCRVAATACLSSFIVLAGPRAISDACRQAQSRLMRDGATHGHRSPPDTRDRLRLTRLYNGHDKGLTTRPRLEFRSLAPRRGHGKTPAVSVQAETSATYSTYTGLSGAASEPTTCCADASMSASPHGAPAATTHAA